MSFSLRVSLMLGESGLLSAVAAASSLSVLVNNSVSSILQPGCDGSCRGAESCLPQTAEGRTWGLGGASVVSGAGAFQVTLLQSLLSPFSDRIVPSILSQLSEPCNQRPQTESRLVKLENLLFIFIPSLFVPWLRNSFACFQSSAGPEL